MRSDPERLEDMSTHFIRDPPDLLWLGSPEIGFRTHRGPKGVAEQPDAAAAKVLSVLELLLSDKNPVLQQACSIRDLRQPTCEVFLSVGRNKCQTDLL